MAARHLGREKQRRPSARESLRGIILGSHLADAIRRSNLRPGKTPSHRLLVMSAYAARPSPRSGYAAFPPPPSRSFGHGLERLRRLSVSVSGEGGEAGRDHLSGLSGAGQRPEA
jgi:hypothetical protein